MGSMTGHRIDYNGVGVQRSQGHIPSKNWPKYPLPLGLSPEKLEQTIKCTSNNVIYYKHGELTEFCICLWLAEMWHETFCCTLCMKLTWISFILYEFNAGKTNYIVDKMRLKLRRKELFEYLTVCFLYTGVDFDFIIFIHCEATLRKREKGSSHDLNFCVWINLSITCQTKVVRTI